MHQPISHPLCCSVSAAGQRLGVGRTTIYALIATGELASVRIRGRRLVVIESVTVLVMARAGRSRLCVSASQEVGQ